MRISMPVRTSGWLADCLPPERQERKCILGEIRDVLHEPGPAKRGFGEIALDVKRSQLEDLRNRSCGNVIEAARQSFERIVAVERQASFLEALSQRPGSDQVPRRSPGVTPKAVLVPGSKSPRL